jgi:hypothetical protein
MRALITLVFVAVTAGVLCSCGTAKAPVDPQRITARVVEFGVFHTELSQRGQTNVVSEAPAMMQTDHVTWGNGVQFGFLFEVNGLPAGEKVTLTQMVRRPVFRYEELSGQNVATTLEPFVATGKADRGTVTYRLGGANGPLPGVYAIELWFRGHMLARKVFVISVPPKLEKRGNRMVKFEIRSSESRFSPVARSVALSAGSRFPTASPPDLRSLRLSL